MREHISQYQIKVWSVEQAWYDLDMEVIMALRGAGTQGLVCIRFFFLNLCQTFSYDLKTPSCKLAIQSIFRILELRHNLKVSFHNTFKCFRL